MHVYLMELHILSGEGSRSSFKVKHHIDGHCRDPGRQYSVRSTHWGNSLRDEDDGESGHKGRAVRCRPLAELRPDKNLSCDCQPVHIKEYIVQEPGIHRVKVAVSNIYGTMEKNITL
ncbi:hypothetical protein DPMN_062979, partial [Dreissena polymorpha]